MSDENRKLTIYYDGACPLCRSEIEHYRAQDEAEALSFVDVSPAGAMPGADLSRSAALARFHVRDRSGALLSGARAFVEVWRSLPRWRWAARVASNPVVLGVLEIGYRISLRVRPWLARRMKGPSR